MADYAAMPFCTRLPFREVQSKINVFIPRNVNVRMSHRDYLLFRGSYPACQLLSSKLVVASPLSVAVKGNECLNEHSSRRCCLGALINPENSVPSNWVSAADQVLLVISVIFAYMAGVIPHKRSNPTATSDFTDQRRDAWNSTSYGRCAKIGIEFNSNDMWNEVKGKLLEAFSANARDSTLDDRTMDSNNVGKKHPLSIFVVTECPRLRLLWITLQQLKQEVSNISQINEGVSREVWLIVASEVIKGLIRPACMKWLEGEINLEIGDVNTQLITSISGKLKGEDAILQNIGRLGKAELYADLLFYLRYGSLRYGCCYGTKFLNEHGVDILEDLVVMMADRIASIYLELVSVDSSMSSEINALGLTLCALSTRALQRLRNEVALNQWLQQNFESVVSMYEDRFELFVICRRKIEDPLENESKKSIWWKKFMFRNTTTLPLMTYVKISTISLPVKRTKELRALTGWRYLFSLFLEFSDITMPFVRTIFAKVSNAVSFFLMCMIGRSLGLIFTGIRQSLGWR